MFSLTCMASELNAALSLASQVSGNPKQVPILSATRIEVASGTATFIATNTDHAIRASVAAEGSGIVHLSTEALRLKAGALRQNQPVTLKQDENFVIVTQAKTRWKLPVIAGDAFPVEFTQPINEKSVNVKREPLFSALVACSRIVNPSDIRIIGQGVFLDMEDGFRCVSAATNGLYVIEIDEPALASSVIIPNDMLRTFTIIFRDSETIDIALNANAIMVSANGVMYKSKLIEGAYVDWRRARDAQTGGLDANAEIYSENFIDAVGRATAIIEDKTKSGIGDGTRFTFSDGQCQILIKNRSGEEGSDEIESQSDGGTFAVSATALINAIETLGSTKVSIAFNPKDDGPILIEPLPKSDRENYRVVMGMLVQK